MLGSGRPDTDLARARLQGLHPRWIPTEADLTSVEAAAPGSHAPSDAVTDAGSTGRVSADGALRPARRHLVPEQRPRRWRLDRSAARGLLSLTLASVVGALAVVVWGWPRGETAGHSDAVAAPAASSNVLVQPEESGKPSAARVVVDVDGEVRRPGVVELASGARVVDAIGAAGGLTARGDTGTLNLAEVLIDGQQVVVPSTRDSAGSAPTPSTGVTAPGTTAASPVSLNSATSEQLETLPGIGPVLAAAIIEWRSQNGGFTSIDQLQEVSGIGPTTFADVAPLVRL